MRRAKITRRPGLRVPGNQEAWAAGSWVVAHADADGITAVTVGDRTWTRARSEDAWSWHAATTPISPTSVTITRQ